MKFEIKECENLKYVIRYPKGYKTGEKYPVILFLHGAGGRETGIETKLDHSFFTRTAQHENFPFVCVMPWCSVNSWFDISETLQRFTKAIYAAEYTNCNQFYLMGNSMGGYGTWQLAMTMPEYFAAIVPICGGGMYWNAGRLVDIPVWAFHGGLDDVVSPEESKKMVDKIRAYGGKKVKLTIYPENDHNAWDDTFDNPEVFAWLLSHKNKKGKELINECKDSVIYG